MEIVEQIARALEKGDATETGQLTRQAIESGLGPKQILDEGLIAGMAVVGERFKRHEIFLPDLLFSAKAMYAGLDLLKPRLVKDGIKTAGKIVIGTVHGDQHDIGKNLVGIMLQGAGFEVIDLGKDVSPEKFVDAAVQHEADVIGMSALLTTTMPVMKQVIELARERGLPSNTKFIVGGAPLTAVYADQIGADAYCFDSVSAVDCVKKFLAGN